MLQDFKLLWKKLANTKSNTARHAVQYAILKAMSSRGEDKVEIAKHFLRKAFTPITNVNKLTNGAIPFQATRCGIIGKKIWRDVLGVDASELLTDEEIDSYNKISHEAAQPDKLIRRYAYFFTRQDIFDEYQLVQTAHVALELGNKLSAEEINGLYFTCCGVEDLRALEDVERVIQSMRLEYIVFREPDIGNQKTSIGVYPVPEHRKGLLKNYDLLRFNRKK